MSEVRQLGCLNLGHNSGNVTKGFREHFRFRLRHRSMHQLPRPAAVSRKVFVQDITCFTKGFRKLFRFRVSLSLARSTFRCRYCITISDSVTKGFREKKIIFVHDIAPYINFHTRDRYYITCVSKDIARFTKICINFFAFVIRLRSLAPRLGVSTIFVFFKYF